MMVCGSINVLTLVSRVGANVPECCSSVMQVSRIDGSFNMSDDIFVFGKDETDDEAYVEHDEYLD